MVGAAMELEARLGICERGDEPGSERPESVLCEVGMLGGADLAIRVQAGSRDKGIISRFGRRCARGVPHTFEND